MRNNMQLQIVDLICIGAKAQKKTLYMGIKMQQGRVLGDIADANT